MRCKGSLETNLIELNEIKCSPL
ncbi:hypothetical protein D047_2795A, partial [Vibrio parahaemolyticus VPTS-2010_2]